ncbi:MAG: YheU family protein [Deltaproteobacteria bacterium]|nr:YheU family protein [Deltaproteobacteria bacterium]
MIIPYEKLSKEALQGLIEEFVTRDGTDSGYIKKALDQNVEMVIGQLRRGDAVVVYDEKIGTANIVPGDKQDEKR